MTVVNDTDESFSEEDTSDNALQLYEIFFADGDVSESDSGLIYKDIMREGEWAYRPGPGQKPTPVPLKVVAGKASSDEEIGMSDLVEAYNDHAIDHVTIPTSHDDKPHENTGYVKELSIIDDGTGKKVLRAGLDFTEPDIKAKALRGSIANTSAGIIFDYIKKDSGKKYRQALGHVALTNKPWLNGMKPFGVLASEDYSDEDYEITPLVLADVVWDSEKSYTWLRDEVSKAINKENDPSEGFWVADISNNKALVTKFDSRSNTEDNFVVPFQVRGGDMKVPDREKWVKASREWVETSLSEEKTYVINNKSQIFGNDESLSEEAPSNRGAVGDPETGGKQNMGSKVDEEKKEKDSGAPSDSPATGLSEDDLKKAQDALKAEFSEKLEAEKERADALRRKVHEMTVNENIEELKGEGFSEYPGLLAEIRNIKLADEGTPAVTLSLSEKEGEEPKEVKLSASEVVDRVIKAIPRKDGKVNFGDQATVNQDEKRPPMTPETSTDLSEEDRSNALAEALGQEKPFDSKDGDK